MNWRIEKSKRENWNGLKRGATIHVGGYDYINFFCNASLANLAHTQQMRILYKAIKTSSFQLPLLLWLGAFWHSKFYDKIRELLFKSQNMINFYYQYAKICKWNNQSQNFIVYIKIHWSNNFISLTICCFIHLWPNCLGIYRGTFKKESF